MYIGLHNSSFRNAVRSDDGLAPRLHQGDSRSRADADPILFRAIAWVLARIGVKI